MAKRKRKPTDGSKLKVVKTYEEEEFIPYRMMKAQHDHFLKPRHQTTLTQTQSCHYFMSRAKVLFIANY